MEKPFLIPGHEYQYDLCWIVEEIKRNFERIQALRVEIKQYVNDKIAATEAELERMIINMFNNYQAIWDKKLKDTITELKQLVLDNNKLIWDNLDLITQEYQAGDEALKTYIDTEIQKLIASIPTKIVVRDPSDGQLEDLQTALNHLWEALHPLGLIAAEYDALMISAEKFDRVQITAINYDRWAKIWLWPFSRPFMVFSGLTGKYIHISDAIYELYSLHQTDGITADNYDILQISASDYDDKDINAKAFDFEAQTFLN